MRRGSGTAMILACAAGLIAAELVVRAPAAEPSTAQEGGERSATAKVPSGEGAAAVIPRPTWKVGDTWVVETITERVQERTQDVRPGPAIRWQFTVAAQEPVGGRPSYRIEVQCLAKGRVRPQTSLWVDAQTMTLREVRTQLAVAGQYRTIQESYETPPGQATPVLTPLNALPIDLPAFVPKGAKALDTYTVISQPMPAGAKPADAVRFAHSVQQEAEVAGAKELEDVPPSFAKDLAAQPVVRVRLTSAEKSVTQLWQARQPWPVFATNGRTKARLISVGRGQ